MLGWFKKAVGGNDRPKEETAATLAEAIRLHAAGDLEPALARYQQLAADSPQQGAPEFLLATVLVQLGRLEESVPFLVQAVENSGDLSLEIEAVATAEELSSLVAAILAAGDAVKSAGRADFAAQYYFIAATLAPRSAEPAFRYADTLHDLRHFEEAEAAFKKALSIDPNHWGACYSYAVLHQDLGRHQEALEFYRRALAIRDNHAKLRNNLGSALNNLGRTGEAVPHFRRAVELDQSFPFAHLNLGMALNELGQWGEARTALENAVAAGIPPAALVRRALVMPVVPQSQEEIAQARNSMQADLQALQKGRLQLQDPILEVAMTPFYLAYHGLDDLPLMRQAADFFRSSCPALRYLAPHCLDEKRPRQGKLRVGFISTYFYNHTIAHYFGPMIRELDREDFEVVVISNFAKRDEVTESIVQSADRVVTVPMQLGEAQRAIAEERLDLLVYCDIGMEPLSYFLAFARLAPVQIALYGHPDTTGISTIDYFLTHEECEPQGAEEHYSERLLKLSAKVSYTCFERPGRAPFVRTRADFGFSEDQHLYLCLQTLFKIQPDMDQIFAGVLAADQSAIIVLWEGRQPEWTELMRSRLQAAGVDMERVRFMPRLAYGEYLELLRLSEVVLDTTHFCGGATTFDAFAMGVPVVTLPGLFLRGRQTYACYRRMGIEDCIADSAADYIEKAVRIATHPAVREEVGGRIASAGDVLFGDRGMIREFEALLKQSAV